ncbi:sigma-70 family RNA polymerase sigma factor [Pedobacter sp. SD-b]|uniref:Sigma-70 family RNA polymerase sigma factor n=1 Tax=Pedobacter segetis TaxID=2793069 RepID=A0ABS1BHC6_9SPHI|nr:sigma-70 family RNA polymerase sigma factor [Pedobacter segetis]MBK0382176.1 sigma-70 family RNA polymerase sigma factor [Pedobacter segetis]
MPDSNFKEIYQTYSPQIYRVCLGYVNDAEQAKDLMQETFISVWKNLTSFRHQSKISTWIFRIATNNCLRHLEKSKRIITTELPFQIEEEVEIDQDDKVKFLYQCVSELEETDRLIISLVLEDLQHSEIANIIGLSVGNIRVRVHRIKEKLTAKFKKHGQFQ